MNSKYELITSDKITVMGHDLYRIRALRDIDGVCEAGEIGGYVQGEVNLNVYGDAWVSGNALVSGNARVSGNALVSGNARVYGNARVSGNARVYGNAQVYGNALVYGDAEISSTPIHISWGLSRLTAYCDFVQIGCKLHTQKEWRTIFKLGTYRSLCGSDAEYAAYRKMFETAVAMLKV